jgi:hypothetical protein
MAGRNPVNSNKLIPAAGQRIGQTVQVLPSRFKRQTGTVRTLTRLSVGLAIIALETVAEQLQEAERETILQKPPEPAPTKEVIVEVVDGKPILGHRPAHSSRHALVGFVFDTQVRLGEGVGRLQEVGQEVESRVSRILAPVTSSRAFAPLRRRYDKVIRQATAQIYRWEELGRTEEAYSRELAENTSEKLIDVTVNYVNQSPQVQAAIQEIIAAQSMGMAGEAIEEVRERTVTGDILLERVVRSIFRRRPRESLPLPPTAVSTNGARPPTKSRK